MDLFDETWETIAWETIKHEYFVLYTFKSLCTIFLECMYLTAVKISCITFLSKKSTKHIAVDVADVKRPLKRQVISKQTLPFSQRMLHLW